MLAHTTCNHEGDHSCEDHPVCDAYHKIQGRHLAVVAPEVGVRFGLAHEGSIIAKAVTTRVLFIVSYWEVICDVAQVFCRESRWEEGKQRLSHR